MGSRRRPRYGDRAMNRAVFLDRDGVINRAEVRGGRPYSPETLDGFEILPGVPGAVTGLKQAGFLAIVVTNQPDVATGKLDRGVVEVMHEDLRARVAVDDIYVCFHTDEDDCNCRKPKTGLIEAAAADWDVDISQSFMVGDRWRDIEAGKAAGCATVLIDYGYTEPLTQEPDAKVASLPEAASWILGQAAKQTETPDQALSLSAAEDKPR